MSENGRALAIVAVCSAPKPPLIKSVAEIAAIIPAHKTRWKTGVSSTPPEAIMLSTKAPLSADVTKKMTIITRLKSER